MTDLVAPDGSYSFSDLVVGDHYSVTVSTRHLDTRAVPDWWYANGGMIFYPSSDWGTLLYTGTPLVVDASLADGDAYTGRVRDNETHAVVAGASVELLGWENVGGVGAWKVYKTTHTDSLGMYSFVLPLTEWFTVRVTRGSDVTVLGGGSALPTDDTSSTDNQMYPNGWSVHSFAEIGVGPIPVIVKASGTLTNAAGSLVYNGVTVQLTNAEHQYTTTSTDVGDFSFAASPGTYRLVALSSAYAGESFYGGGVGVDVVLTTNPVANLRIVMYPKSDLQVQNLSFFNPSPHVGEDLVAGTSSFGPVCTGVSIAWFSDGVPVAARSNGSSTSTYVPTGADFGHRLSVRGTPTGCPGTAIPTVVSSIDLVGQGTYYPAYPYLVGDPAVGTVLTYRLAGQPQVTGDISVQWLAGGQPIAGATSSSFTPTPTQVGQRISVRITESGAGYPTTTWDSPASSVIAGPKVAITFSGKVAVRGTAKVGKTVKAVTTGWPAGTKLAYRWYASGKAIKKATKSSFKITSSVKSKRLSLKVTAAKSGYTTTTVTTKLTGTVKAK